MYIYKYMYTYASMYVCRSHQQSEERGACFESARAPTLSLSTRGLPAFFCEFEFVDFLCEFVEYGAPKDASNCPLSVQCVAVCCSVLQCVAVCCSVLQSVAL